ncbi:MAG: PAS domain S-box protein [Methanothrix sp.]|nr:PAS domain S-box protein [Methanothrix sp.]
MEAERSLHAIDINDIDDDLSKQIKKLVKENADLKANISKLKKTEIEFKAHQQLLDIIDFLPDATFVIDHDKKVIAWNRAIEALTGVSAQEMLGKGDFEYALPFYGKRRPILIDLVLKPVHEIEEQYCALHRDGVAIVAEIYLPSFKPGGIYMWSKASPLYDSDGNLAGAIESMRDITKRKKVEIALQENLRFLQHLIDTIPSPIFYKDIKGLYQGCNVAYERYLGLSKEQITGKSVYDVFPSDLADKYQEMDQALFRKPGIQVYESSLMYADGSRHDVVFNKATYTDARGNLSGLVGIVQDITDRKRAVEALRESEEKYRHLVENLNDVIYTMDSQGYITYISPIIEKLSGYSANEVIGQHFSRFVPPEDLPGLNESFQHSMQGEIEPYEFRIVHKSGHMCYVRTSSRLLLQENQKLGLSGVITDITDRRHAEEALSNKDRLLQGVALATNILLTETDLDSAINQTLELLGSAAKVDRVYIFRNHQSETGDHFASLHHEWVKDVVTPLMENQDFPNFAIQGVASQNITMRSFAYHPALRRWYETMSSGCLIKGLAHEFPEPERVMLESRQVKSLLAFPILLEDLFWGFVSFEDCHCQRIWTGADVSILHASVASIGGAIIRKQAEDDLREAKDAAEASAIAKSQFMANMSHELRTPMNAVVGMTSLLLNGELTPDQRRSIETIRSSGQDLMFLINGILDFAKLGEGRVELESQPFELCRCIEDTIELRACAASEKGLELSCTFDREAGDIPDMIMGDPTRIRQVLGNLLDNAIKFTNRGTVQVIVSSKLAGDSSQIHFAVKDTGIGIPQDQMHKLFLPFSQVDCTSTSKYTGTGLGLAVCQKLVELMGGRIWVESEIGKGSTFYFTILAREVKGKQTTANNIKPKECLLSGPPAPLRILLAEDNEVNQLVMLKMLKRLGYRADIAANGIEAIQAMERQPYDIVLMDVKMPEMDGLQAARIIRKLWPQGPKIVAITAYALQGDRERCLEAGMDEYVSKPVKMEELAEVLANVGCLGASREPMQDEP